MIPFRKEKGVAILVAIFFVALISTIAVSIVYTQQLNVQRLSNILQRDQAYLFAMAGEPWFTELINGRVNFQGVKISSYEIDFVNRNALDQASFSIEILDKEGKYPLGEFSITEVADLQGRFNLTNLVNLETGEVNGAQQSALISLLNNLPNPPDGFSDNIEIIVDSIVDWIDTNQEAMPNGAEDGYYQALDDERNKPYSAPNRVMSSPTEIMKIRGMNIPGMSEEYFEHIEKHICVLPKNTRLNMNTASPEVIQAVLAITGEQAEDFKTERRSNSKEYLGFTNMTGIYSNTKFNFLARNTNQPGTPPLPRDTSAIITPARQEELNQIIDVMSNYYLIKTQATYGDAVLNLQSVLHIQRPSTAPAGGTPPQKEVRILVRAQGTY